MPSDIEMHEGKFNFDKTTFLLLPEKESRSDNFLARFLFNEIVDKYEYSVSITKRSDFSKKDKFILIGSVENSLVKKY